VPTPQVSWKEENDGVSVFENGKLTPAAREVLEVIKKRDLILKTGHLSPSGVSISSGSSENWE